MRRRLPSVGALAIDLLRWAWQAFLDGAALHAASFYGVAYFQHIERMKPERRFGVVKSSEK